MERTPSHRASIMTAGFWLGLVLVVALLVAVRLPILRCDPLVAGTPFFLDERDYLGLAHSLAAGDAAADTVRPWVRAPMTSLVLLGLSRLRGLPPELTPCDFEVFQMGLWAVLLLSMA